MSDQQSTAQRKAAEKEAKMEAKKEERAAAKAEKMEARAEMREAKKEEKAAAKVERQHIKELSLALFMGASLHEKFVNKVIAIRNRKIVEMFSKPIAQVNRPFFVKKMDEKLAP